jgi:hypothetical protein
LKKLIKNHIKVKHLYTLMPAKKTNSTQATEVKAKTTKKVEAKQVKEEAKPEPKQVVQQETTEATDTKKKMVRKAGRTLLVSPTNGSSLSESTFSKLTGLSVTHSTKNGSYFLTFDSVQNALDSFRSLRQDHPELRVKFARYQIFFTVTGLTDSSDYSTVKQNMTNFVEKESGANVLYFKLYRKGDKYLGCGDLTVDTKDAMDKLLNKEGSLKNYTVGELSGTFYRYNKTQTKQEGDEEHEHA